MEPRLGFTPALLCAPGQVTAPLSVLMSHTEFYLLHSFRTGYIAVLKHVVQDLAPCRGSGSDH